MTILILKTMFVIFAALLIGNIIYKDKGKDSNIGTIQQFIEGIDVRNESAVYMGLVSGMAFRYLPKELTRGKKQLLIVIIQVLFAFTLMLSTRIILYYLLASLIITGYNYSKEQDSQNLAEGEIEEEPIVEPEITSQTETSQQNETDEKNSDEQAFYFWGQEDEITDGKADSEYVEDSTEEDANYRIDDWFKFD